MLDTGTVIAMVSLGIGTGGFFLAVRRDTKATHLSDEARITALEEKVDALTKRLKAAEDREELCNRRLLGAYEEIESLKKRMPA